MSSQHSSLCQKGGKRHLSPEELWGRRNNNNSNIRRSAAAPHCEVLPAAGTIFLAQDAGSRFELLHPGSKALVSNHSATSLHSQVWVMTLCVHSTDACTAFLLQPILCGSLPGPLCPRRRLYLQGSLPAPITSTCDLSHVRIPSLTTKSCPPHSPTSHESLQVWHR